MKRVKKTQISNDADIQKPFFLPNTQYSVDLPPTGSISTIIGVLRPR
ncbi:hypothetical protein SAMN02745702_01624 [Desulfobaculum bizertense DSM 18034]|uniref:Uncharacterized protein n=1 Tax=Desulfobaculum bizertense DSM 18034 TaxID=1121442 RepID=A0A1T4W4Q1_9BACT|nr:hypothetical protein SAMN02745702_01624 [Desulfobaculum bizertense DSM 18034]